MKKYLLLNNIYLWKYYFVKGLCYHLYIHYILNQYYIYFENIFISSTRVGHLLHSIGGATIKRVRYELSVKCAILVLVGTNSSISLIIFKVIVQRVYKFLIIIIITPAIIAIISPLYIKHLE